MYTGLEKELVFGVQNSNVCRAPPRLDRRIVRGRARLAEIARGKSDRRASDQSDWCDWVRLAPLVKFVPRSGAPEFVKRVRAGRVMHVLKFAASLLLSHA